MEVLFWGIAYGTGRILTRTPIVSFGKWRADRLVRDEDSGKINKRQSGVEIIHKSGSVYFGAIGVCLIGIGFWALVIVGFTFT